MPTKIDQHPTVQKLRQQAATPRQSVTAEQLKQMCLDAGADDAAVISIDRDEMDAEREEITGIAPWTRCLVSIVCRMNRDPVRSPARSMSNLEFHHTGEDVNEVARKVVAKLEAMGIRAANPSMGFPMEVGQFPGKIWSVSHKPVAVAAGLGQMGIHRNVIHPKFGNFILLGTILVDQEIEPTEEAQPIDYNPCVDCKLCVAACPVGAIAPDGHFDFNSCYTHNYREFMGGFTDWTETLVASRSRNEYRSRVSDGESASMWQSLSFGANYKAAYCLAVCPAGEDVLAPWLEDRTSHLQQYLKPLQEKEELVYVIPGSDAEQHVTKRYPHKTPRQVRGSLHPSSIANFLEYMPHLFQRGQSKGLEATYHFTFTGQEPCETTITIRDQKIEVEEGHVGKAQLKVTADSETWLRFLKREVSLAWALLSLRIRMKGSPLWLVKFGKCFPS